MYEQTDEPEIIELPEVATAVIADELPMERLPELFDRAFPAIFAVIGSQGATPTGAPFARYNRPPTDTVDIEVGLPVAAPITADGEVRPGTLPAGRAAHLTHRGGYDGLGGSWGRLVSWVLQQGHRPDGTMWEIYVTEPTPEADPADMVTELFLAVGA